MTELIYALNIHLFAFQAEKGFVPDAATLKLEPNLLWKKYQNIAQNFSIEPKKIEVIQGNLPATRVDILIDPDHKGKVFQALRGKIVSHHYPPIEIRGLAYPLWNKDSYILTLNIRRPQKENEDAVEISRLREFNPDGCFLPKLMESNLGQTLLITAFLNLEQQQKHQNDLRELAEACYRNFTSIKPDQILEFNRVDDLFGSPIFEYSIPGYPTEYGHFLIWFFFSETTSEKFSETYQQFSDIFFYRSKIVKAYQLSREDYEDGLQLCQQIGEEIGSLKQLSDEGMLTSAELLLLNQKLKQLLQKTLKYSQLLRNLQFYRTTIEINADKYREKLKQIQNLFPSQNSLKPDDLSFLKQFGQDDCSQFQAQIQANLNELLSGATLLDQTISTIRGMVEIDNAERGRSLENTIQAVGFAIAMALVVASSAPYLLRPEPQTGLFLPFTPPNLHPFVQVLLLSLGAGASAWLLVWLLTNWSRKNTKGRGR